MPHVFNRMSHWLVSYNVYSFFVFIVLLLNVDDCFRSVIVGEIIVNIVGSVVGGDVNFDGIFFVGAFPTG